MSAHHDSLTDCRAVFRTSLSDEAQKEVHLEQEYNSVHYCVKYE